MKGGSCFASVTVTLIYLAKRWRLGAESGTGISADAEAAELTAKRRFHLATCALTALLVREVSLSCAAASPTPVAEIVCGAVFVSVLLHASQEVTVFFFRVDLFLLLFGLVFRSFRRPCPPLDEELRAALQLLRGRPCGYQSRAASQLVQRSCADLSSA